MANHISLNNVIEASLDEYVTVALIVSGAVELEDMIQFLLLQAKLLYESNRQLRNSQNIILSYAN